MDPNHPGGQSIHFCITLAIHKDAYTLADILSS